MDKLKKIWLYASWVLLAPLDLIVQAVAILLAPFAALYVDKDGHLLPIFWWMETYDNPLEGDSGHIERWTWFRENLGWFGLYLQHVAWMWRNKAYNWSYYAIGREAESEIHWRGNKDTSSDPEDNQTGYFLLWNDSCWGLFAFIPHIRIGNIQFYLRVYIGWKLKSEVDNPDKRDRVMCSTHVNPFRYGKISK